MFSWFASCLDHLRQQFYCWWSSLRSTKFLVLNGSNNYIRHNRRGDQKCQLEGFLWYFEFWIFSLLKCWPTVFLSFIFDVLWSQSELPTHRHTQVFKRKFSFRSFSFCICGFYLNFQTYIYEVSTRYFHPVGLKEETWQLLTPPTSGRRQQFVVSKV